MQSAAPADAYVGERTAVSGGPGDSTMRFMVVETV